MTMIPEIEIEQEDRTLIGKVEKNETTEIQVAEVVFKGQTYFDIREFVNGENYQGPTKRGIRLHSSLMAEMLILLGQGLGVKMPASDPSDDEYQEEAQLVGTISKNDTTTVQLRSVTYKEQQYFDLREFVDGENYQGPTKRGIRIHDSLLPALISLMQDERLTERD